MPKCNFNKVAYNFIEITLRHGCFPVNLLHIFRTPFPRNTSGRLLLNVNTYKKKTSKDLKKEIVGIDNLKTK